MEPTTLLPAIVLLSLVTVESGGWALLGFITARRGALDAAQHQAFRAGHAHAGVLLVLAVAVAALFDRADLGRTTEWVLGSLLLAGILAQSGGFFLHLAFGLPLSTIGGHGSPEPAPSSSPFRSRGLPLACSAPDR